MYMLIPNVTIVEDKLNELAEILGASEILLFERATFLVIAHSEKDDHRDAHRFEKISNIIKQFKLSCSRLATQFQVRFNFGRKNIRQFYFSILLISRGFNFVTFSLPASVRRRSPWSSAILDFLPSSTRSLRTRTSAW